MTDYFMSDKKLEKLRERQRHVQWLIHGEAHPRDWPYPRFVDWHDEDRRRLEVAIRIQCASEVRKHFELVERLEARQRSHLVSRAIGSVPGMVTFNDSRATAVTILEALAPEPQHETTPEDAVNLAVLRYLLDVAKLLESGGHSTIPTG
ncbi:MAG: hypothetical protein ABIQ73_02780 [Acidimicrobiales bacterium]